MTLDRVAEAEAEMASVIEKRVAIDGNDAAATLRARTSHAVYLDALGRRTQSEVAWGNWPKQAAGSSGAITLTLSARVSGLPPACTRSGASGKRQPNMAR